MCWSLHEVHEGEGSIGNRVTDVGRRGSKGEHVTHAVGVGEEANASDCLSLGLESHDCSGEGVGDVVALLETEASGDDGAISLEVSVGVDGDASIEGGSVLVPHALEVGEGAEDGRGGTLGHVQVVGDELVGSVAQDAVCVVTNSSVASVQGVAGVVVPVISAERVSDLVGHSANDRDGILASSNVNSEAQVEQVASASSSDPSKTANSVDVSAGEQVVDASGGGEAGEEPSNDGRAEGIEELAIVDGIGKRGVRLEVDVGDPEVHVEVEAVVGLDVGEVVGVLGDEVSVGEVGVSHDVVVEHEGHVAVCCCGGVHDNLRAGVVERQRGGGWCCFGSGDGS